MWPAPLAYGSAFRSGMLGIRRMEVQFCLCSRAVGIVQRSQYESGDCVEIRRACEVEIDAKIALRIIGGKSQPGQCGDRARRQIHGSRLFWRIKIKAGRRRARDLL